MKRSRSKTKKNKPRHTPQTDIKFLVPKAEVVDCPACGKKIVWAKYKDTIVALDPQLRIVVFSDIPHDISPEDNVLGIEVGESEVVNGRVPNARERVLFRANGTLDNVVPWTLCRTFHLLKCTRWDRWISGDAKPPTALESSDSISGKLYLTAEETSDTMSTESCAETNKRDKKAAVEGTKKKKSRSSMQVSLLETE